MAAYLGVMLFVLRAAGLYFSLMESSPPGHAGQDGAGHQVVNAAADGSRSRMPGPLVRRVAVHVTLYIGFLMAAFTGKKQALHDLVAGTFVVDRWAYTEFPERQQRTWVAASSCL